MNATIRLCLLSISSAVALGACDGNSQPFLEAAEIQTQGITSLQVIPPPKSLSATEVRLSPGQEFQLGLQGLTESTSEEPVSLDATGRRWNSTDPEVALVDGNGLVVAKQVGSASISVEISGITASSYNVIVNNATLRSMLPIEHEGTPPAEPCLPEALEVNGEFTDGFPRRLASVQWSANLAGSPSETVPIAGDNSFATLTAITPNASVDVSAASDGIAPTTLQVDVANSLDSIAISANRLQLKVGDEVQLKATGTYKDTEGDTANEGATDENADTPDESESGSEGTTGANRETEITNSVTWSVTSGQASVQLDSNSGRLTVIAAGTAQVRASCGETTSELLTLTIPQNTQEVDEISFNVSNPLTLRLGSARTVVRVSTGGRYESDDDVSDEVEWELGEGAGAFVRTTENADFLSIEAIRTGRALLTASYKDIEKVLTVDVVAAN